MSNHKRGRKPLWIAIGTILLWLMIGGVVGPLFGNLSSVQKNDNSKFLPAATESAEVAKVTPAFTPGVKENFPALALLIGTVTPEKIAATNAFLAAVVEKPLVDEKGVALKGAYGKVISTPIKSYISPGSPIMALPSQSGKAAFANIPIDGGQLTKQLANKTPVLPALITSLRYYISDFAKTNGWSESHLTGIGAIFGDLFGAFGTLDSSLLLVTALVIALILIVVYRSPVLWILPLFTAMLALTLAGGVIYGLAKAGIIDLDGQSQGILSVLVLGAATDYALLLIARYREELHVHESRFDAMKVAWRGVVEPIIASGSTVTIGLLVLLLCELTNNRGLGPVGAIGIVCSMITVLTLLPALLVVFGRWIFWPKKPKMGDSDERLTGAWSKVANATARKPRKYWIITAAGLIILAAFSTTLGANGISQTDTFTKKPDSVIGAAKFSQYFAAGQGQPTQILVKQELAQKATDTLLAIKGVASVVPFVNPANPNGGTVVVDGNVILQATLVMAPDSVKARELVPVLRDAMHKLDSSILTGGSSAVNYDVSQAARHDRNLIIPVVLIVIALILALLLRSLAAAALLLATVVLSFLATLGACALVFHHLFHFAGEDTSFPLFAFIFLVALGIDYNIFLMTRVREETLKIGTRAGMTKGVTVTGGVITSAGIVLAATFTVLGILPLVFLAELGFAVAFGVLLDTLIVRSILVPALVHVIGKKIWWPSQLSKAAE